MNGIKGAWKQRTGQVLRFVSCAWMQKAEVDEHRLKFESASAEIANADLSFAGGVGLVGVMQVPMYVFAEGELT